MRPAARLEIVGPLLNSRNRNPSPAANDRTGLGQSGQARTHVYARRRRAPRVDATSMSPENNEGAGNAGCALHPRSRVQNCAKKRTRAYRFSGGTPAFPAQWLYGLLRAPRRIGLCCLRRLRIAGSSAPGRADLPSADLTPTTEASGPHDFTVRFSIVRPALRRPLTETRPANKLHTRHRRVHRIPSQRSVTMANAPSSGTGWRES